MLDTHQLNIFLAVAETLSFSNAARQLHLTQPAVSQHIRALEQQFGLPLFLRSGRNTTLTDAGVALIPLARQMVEKSLFIEEKIKSLEGEVYGHLYVGCSTTPGKYILPQLLAAFHRRYPRVRATCQVTSQADSLQKLCDGEVHFSLISNGLPPCQHIDFIKFMTDHIVLIAPLNHPWAAKPAIEPDDLYDADFIFREKGSGTQQTVIDGLVEVGIDVDQLESLLTLGNSEAIALAVQEGIGVGFVSSLIVSKMVPGRVATIPIRGVRLEREISIGIHTRRPTTTAQSTFWEFIQNEEFLLDLTVRNED